MYDNINFTIELETNDYMPLMFVEHFESGIGIRNSNISKAHANRSV